MIIVSSSLRMLPTVNPPDKSSSIDTRDVYIVSIRSDRFNPLEPENISQSLIEAHNSKFSFRDYVINHFKRNPHNTALNFYYFYHFQTLYLNHLRCKYVISFYEYTFFIH